MTALFAAATAIGLAILVVVVIRVDTDLRWSAMSEALLEQAQAGAGAVVVDDGVDVERFLSDATLTGGWPQVWIYEADGDEAFPAAGPVDDWYDAELDGYAAAVIFDGTRWVEEVEVVL